MQVDLCNQMTTVGTMQVEEDGAVSDSGLVKDQYQLLVSSIYTQPTLRMSSL